MKISESKTSNGWLQNFLRQSGVQSSFKLRGKGGTSMFSGTAEQISEMKDQLANNETRNIYNFDEFRLFYRMGRADLAWHPLTEKGNLWH